MCSCKWGGLRTSDALHDHVAADRHCIRKFGAARGARELEEEGVVLGHADAPHVLDLNGTHKINHAARHQRTTARNKQQQK